MRRIVPLAALALAAAAWSAVAETSGRLSNLATTARTVQRRTGAERIVTLRATFDVSLAAAYDARRDPLDVSLGAGASFHVETRSRHWSFRAGKVRYRGPRTDGAPRLKRLVLWPARGTVRLTVGGTPPTGPLLGQDPLPVVLQLGAAKFEGLVTGGAPAAPGTNVPFTATDTWPETFICSAGTVVVNDAAVWAGLWTSHSFDTRPRPDVDFDTSVVVGVFLGPRENRRFGARVSRVEERADDILVTYTETRPADGCAATQQPICLYAFATIPRSAKPVVFAHAVELACVSY